MLRFMGLQRVRHNWATDLIWSDMASVLDRILQRNRTNRGYITICVSISPLCKEIYYKELVHPVLEAEKSRDLQLASWRPRRAESQGWRDWYPRSKTVKQRETFSFSLFLKKARMNFIYLFLAVLDLCCCVWIFFSYTEWARLSGCSARASCCGGFSCRGAGVLGSWASIAAAHKLSSCSSRPWAQYFWVMSLVALQHVESPRTRNQTHVPCIGRWILNQWTTREVPLSSLLFYAGLQ